MSEITPVRVWPDLIFKTKYPHDLDLAANRSLETCKQLPESFLEKGGGRSSIVQQPAPCEWDELKDFYTWLNPVLDTVWDSWGMRPGQRVLQNTWVNWHPNGAWTEDHDHNGAHLVAVLYLKKPAGSGDLQFQDPLNYYWFSYAKNKHFRQLWQNVETEAGDVLIFPGWMRHKTEINTSNEDRVVLTANFKLVQY